MLLCQRDHFFLPTDTHYLNCAYMAPFARTVEAAGIEGIRRRRVPTDVGADDFFADSDRVRARFAVLVGVEAPERVAIVPSASYGLAVAARNTPLGRGQHVVLLHEQFPSNVYTWRRRAAEAGATIRTVRPPGDGPGRGRAWNERLLDAIDGETAVVAVPHVHWSDGTLFDLEAVGARAREVGAALVVDGTQSVGALPFDVSRIRPDALVCAGYKWLLGPYGLGVAYFGERYDDGVPIEENWITRRDSHHFSRLVEYEDRYAPGAVRYDVGERSNFILLPMLLAGLEHLHTWGITNIADYCRRLTAPMIAEARALGYRIEDNDARAPHLFGIRVPRGGSPERLIESLAAHRVTASVRGSAVRVAPHVYNDEADAGALLQALRAARA